MEYTQPYDALLAFCGAAGERCRDGNDKQTMCTHKMY